MNLKEILSISGTPGLFKFVAQGKGGIIVESIDASKRRTMVSGATKVSSLGDIAIFTDSTEVPLSDIFESLYKVHKGAVAIDGKSTPQDLETFLAGALADFDRSRVHNSDIKKLASWYNILVTAGHTSFVEVEEQDGGADAATPKKSAAKKPAATKAAVKNPKGAVSSKSKAPSSKSTTARKSS